jgi:hypothetical protein
MEIPARARKSSSIAWAELPPKHQESQHPNDDSPKTMEIGEVVESDSDDDKDDYDIYDSSKVVESESEEEDPNEFINDISDTMTSVTEGDLMAMLDESAEFRDKKRKITVPHPFSFSDREATKKQSIHQRRSREYLASIEAEEKHHLNYRVKANPVPASTLEDKYDTLERRRNISKRHIKTIAKQEYDKLVKPFSFAERDETRAKQQKELQNEEGDFHRQFEARSVPKSTKEPRFERIMRVREKMRETRRIHRAKELAHRSYLPPRMAMHQMISETLPPKIGDKKKCIPDFTHQPKIKKDVPDFSRLQHEFYTQLAVTKKKKPNTR